MGLLRKIVVELDGPLDKRRRDSTGRELFTTGLICKLLQAQSSELIFFKERK